MPDVVPFLISCHISMTTTCTVCKDTSVCLLLLCVYLRLQWRQRVCFDLCLVTTVQLLTSASELRAHCAGLEWVSFGNGSPTKPVTERATFNNWDHNYCLETSVWLEKLPCCTVSWIRLGLAWASSTLVIQQRISLYESSTVCGCRK